MQTCDDIDINKIIPIEDVFSRFEYISYISSGSYADVYKVLDNTTNKIYAMKVVNHFLSLDEGGDEDLEVDDFANNPFDEIDISCRLFNGLKYTHSLLVPEYWTMATKHVVKEENGIEFVNEGNSEIFIFPLLQFTLSKLLKSIVIDRDWVRKNNVEDITWNDIRSIFFELKVAIHVLSLLNIQHADLHFSNIMININITPRVYEINGNKYLIKSRFMPVIIDFGIVIDSSNISNIQMNDKLILEVSDYLNGTEKLLTLSDAFLVDELSPGTYTLFSNIKIE